MPPALMLASLPAEHGQGPEATIRRLMAEGGWCWEFKFDGIRALVTMSDGAARITNRTGRDITFRYPDVVQQVAGLTDMVLDGEIVCLRDGRPDFHLVHRRDAQASARKAAELAAVIPAQFVVFDVLGLGGVDTRALPYTQRRQELVERSQLLQRHGVVVPPSSDDGALLWRAVANSGMEGLIAKRARSRYVGRRSPDWLKLKLTRRVTALVSGWDAGEGSRASTFGSLWLSLLDDETGALVPVGSVGSGFTDAEVTSVWGRLRANDHPIMVEVAYLEVSPDGRLRQPVMKGIRTDLAATDCVLSQLVEGRPSE